VEKILGINISLRTKANSIRIRKLFGDLVEERRKKLKETRSDQNQSIVDVMLNSEANMTTDEVF